MELTKGIVFALAALAIISGSSRANDLQTIQAIVAKAYDSGAVRAVVPKGTYVLEDPKGEGISGQLLLFEKLNRKFEIDMTGVTLVAADRKDIAVLFRNCANVTFKGAVIRRAISPVSQGTIVAIDPSHAVIDVRVHDGYPRNMNDSFFPRVPILKFFQPGSRVLDLG